MSPRLIPLISRSLCWGWLTASVLGSVSLASAQFGVGLVGSSGNVGQSNYSGFNVLNGINNPSVGNSSYYGFTGLGSNGLNGINYPSVGYPGYNGFAGLGYNGHGGGAFNGHGGLGYHGLGGNIPGGYPLPGTSGQYGTGYGNNFGAALVPPGFVGTGTAGLGYPGIGGINPLFGLGLSPLAIHNAVAEQSLRKRPSYIPSYYRAYNIGGIRPSQPNPASLNSTKTPAASPVVPR